jgi:superoxide reductase
MTKKLEIYKCLQCGNIVEVMHGEGSNLVCCSEDMVLLVANKTEAATEKHIPVLSKTDKGYLVQVGEVAHPMTDAHYIEWIELIDGAKVYCKFLKPGDKPEADFCVQATNPTARAYCNLHGLWSN